MFALPGTVRDVRFGWWSQPVDATLILEGKDGVYSEGSAISSRFHSGREGGAVKSLAERGSRSNDRTGV